MALDWITFGITAVALLGFVASYWYLLTGGFTSTNPPGNGLTYVASALSGLVGGVAAAAFGQSLPKADAAGTGESTSFVAAKLEVAGDFLVPFGQSGIREAFVIAYVVVYIGMSVWAIVEYVRKDDTAPALVRDLAMVSTGLMVAIVGTFLKGT